MHGGVSPTRHGPIPSIRALRNGKAGADPPDSFPALYLDEDGVAARLNLRAFDMLLYAVNEDTDRYAVLRRWREDALNGHESVGLSWTAVSGFLRVATNLKVYPEPMSTDEALTTKHWVGYECRRAAARR